MPSTTSAAANAAIGTTAFHPSHAGQADRIAGSAAMAACTRRFIDAQNHGDGSGTSTVSISASVALSSAAAVRHRSHVVTCAARSSGQRAVHQVDQLVGLETGRHRTDPRRLRRLARAWKTLAFTAPTLVPTISATSRCDSSW